MLFTLFIFCFSCGVAKMAFLCWFGFSRIAILVLISTSLLHASQNDCFSSSLAVNLDLLGADVREMTQGVKQASMELVHNKNNKVLKVRRESGC